MKRTSKGCSSFQHNPTQILQDVNRNFPVGASLANQHEANTEKCVDFHQKKFLKIKKKMKHAAEKEADYKVIIFKAPIGHTFH